MDDVQFEGRIVGRFCNDIDKPTTYRVSIIDNENPLERKKFVDISAERDYYKARMSFVDANPNDKTALDINYENKNVRAMQKEKRLQQKRLRQEEADRINATNSDGEDIVNNEVNHILGTSNSVAIIRRKKPKRRKLKESNTSLIPLKNGTFKLKALFGIQSFMKDKPPISASSEEVTEVTIATPKIFVPENISLIPVVSLNASSTLNNNILQISEVVSKTHSLEMLNNNSIPIPLLTSRGRVIRSSCIDEQYCECGCKQKYNTTMIKCKGGTRRIRNTKCQKLLNIQCVPNWLCNDCDTTEWKDLK